jgi:hypothetical protein
MGRLATCVRAPRIGQVSDAPWSAVEIRNQPVVGRLLPHPVSVDAVHSPPRLPVIDAVRKHQLFSPVGSASRN